MSAVTSFFDAAFSPRKPYIMVGLNDGGTAFVVPLESIQTAIDTARQDLSACVRIVYMTDMQYNGMREFSGF